ncbi:MAG TPA: SRPBCC family protein [Nitrolancea sp.]|nr:SRPBCC family protein [Nitrolancea sp.]
MARDDYHLVTRWRVLGTVEEVTEVLRRGTDFPRWWPAVYLDVRELDPGDENGLDAVIDLHSKGWLPYTIRWRSRAVEVRHPWGFTIEATGDFVGHGVWTFEQDSDWVNVTYDWRVRTTSPLLRYGAVLFKPLYEWNHRWAMTKGEESLKLELARRSASTPAAYADIPAPPGPTTTSPVPLLIAVAGIVGAGAGLTYLAWKAWRSRTRFSATGSLPVHRLPDTLVNLIAILSSRPAGGIRSRRYPVSTPRPSGETARASASRRAALAPGDTGGRS